jgi:hypothetical protein
MEYLLHGNEPKKKDARSARARSNALNQLALNNNEYNLVSIHITGGDQWRPMSTQCIPWTNYL